MNTLFLTSFIFLGAFNLLAKEVKFQGSHNYNSCNSSFYNESSPCENSYADVCYDETAENPWMLNKKYVSKSKDEEEEEVETCTEIGMC